MNCVKCNKTAIGCILKADKLWAVCQDHQGNNPIRPLTPEANAGKPTKERKNMNNFEKLNTIDVNQYAKRKGRFTYLSWAHAVQDLLRVFPSATWDVHLFDGPQGQQPYMQNESGCYVKVTVTVDGVERTQIHPVLNHQNKPIPKPNAFQVNTSIQRCLTKAISLHGLGLYIYAGEDLPQGE